eukprot:scaffold454487_cov24-Prasinocladus_malaysianus.AAC.1
MHRTLHGVVTPSEGQPYKLNISRLTVSHYDRRDNVDPTLAATTRNGLFVTQWPDGLRQPLPAARFHCPDRPRRPTRLRFVR